MCLGSVVAKPMLFPTTYMGSICELMSLVAGLGVRRLGRECLEYLVDRETRVHPNHGSLFWIIFPLLPSGSSSSGTPGPSRSLNFLEPVSSHHGDSTRCEG